MPKPLKIVFSILGAIIIGAIGSGVWEKILSPVFSYILQYINKFISSLFESYRDSIYSAAASSLADDYSFRSFIVATLLTALILLVTTTITCNPFKTSLSSVSPSTKDRLQQLPLLVSLAFCATVLISTSRHESIKKTNSYCTRSLHIVRPYITEPEYHKLYSDFYQIKNAVQFNDLNKKLIDISKNHKLRLPEFESF